MNDIATVYNSSIIVKAVREMFDVKHDMSYHSYRHNALSNKKG